MKGETVAQEGKPAGTSPIIKQLEKEKGGNTELSHITYVGQFGIYLRQAEEAGGHLKSLCAAMLNELELIYTACIVNLEQRNNNSHGEVLRF